MATLEILQKYHDVLALSKGIAAQIASQAVEVLLQP